MRSLLALDLLNSFRKCFDAIEKDQLALIDQSAEMIAESVTNGGAWHVHDTGHIIDRELIHRGGGLMFIRPFRWSFSVEDPVPACLRNRPPVDPNYDVAKETVRLAVHASNLRAGDVITIGSVSGRSFPQIELALQCREIGCKVIVISSHNYSTQVEPKHPSGKRLFECADIFLDNLAPLGDGHMQVEGYDVPLFPLSGINAAMITWMIVAGVVEKMNAKGAQPQIWKSANIDGGADRNRQVETEIVDKVGY
ncbi:MAG: sugar isomerase domain-containing protein [Armatimonadetes bacterium]|nr:sugar isomerase domain-containing protein [Armatimonadota bacterium]MDI9582631.1 sugar isomerase domain-containing protein [Acidobacteriota bacterium]